MTSYPAEFPAPWAVYQRQTIDRTFTYYAADGVTPIDLSNANGARFTIRMDNKDFTLVIELTTTPNSNGSRVYLGAALGTYRVYIADEDTKNFPFGNAVCDAFITYSDGTVEALFFGPMTIARRVGFRGSS